MKININKVKLKPKNLNFGFCVYGEPTQEIIDWSKYWKLKLENSGAYTNIEVPADISIFHLFEDIKIFEYGDFFSPNLNKHLHLGHLSNLIIAKCFQSLGLAKNTVAILGDTLDGAVTKEDALNKYNEYCNKFGYHINKIFFASEQNLIGNLLSDGIDEYEGTKVFNLSDQKIVGLKSDGSSTYFYQDVALATYLNASTLYLTGTEQIPHFQSLKELFPHINHIGLGLVMVNGKKSSSSNGNVYFMEQVLDLVKAKFNNDEKLTWNVLSGIILKYDLPSTKDIKMKDIDNVKTSHGLYLSYTLARLKSAGMKPNEINMFNSKMLQYKLLRTWTLLKPNILFEELVELCAIINKLYIDNHIKDNPDNQAMFQPMLDDLVYGMKLLGMFEIDKV